MTWKTISTTLKYQNRYMRVMEEVFKTPSHETVTYGIVRKEPFCIIVPFDGTRVLLVGQYRPQIDYLSWEFPMGHAETDTPLIAAKRELQEETGLQAEELTEIGRFYPAPGTMDQLGIIFVARQWIVGETSREPSEREMQQKWVTLAELESLISDGTIKDGPTIIALHYFQSYLSALG